MEYLLLIVEEEGIRETWSEEDRQADMQRWFDYTEEIGASGVMRDGKALHPSSTATTVRVQPDGQTVTTDGPFAEAKEIINGYYLVEVDDLDQAIHWAEKLPTLGAVEVRPVVDMSQYQ
jgi:hypothetical protein